MDILIGWFPLFRLPGCLCVLLYHIICWWFPLFFISVIIFFSFDWFFLYFLILCWSFTVFLYFSPKFSEHFNDCYFELFIIKVTYVHFIRVLPPLEVYLVLSFGTFSSFSLTFCVCLYELGKTGISPGLQGVPLCRSASMQSVYVEARVRLGGMLVQPW